MRTCIDTKGLNLLVVYIFFHSVKAQNILVVLYPTQNFNINKELFLLNPCYGHFQSFLKCTTKNGTKAITAKHNILIEGQVTDCFQAIFAHPVDLEKWFSLEKI